MTVMFPDQYRAYKVGDPVLIHGMTSEGGDDTEGRIVHTFTLSDDPRPLYVIEIDTPLDPVYEVRSGHFLEMKPAPGTAEYDSWGAFLDRKADTK